MLVGPESSVDPDIAAGRYWVAAMDPPAALDIVAVQVVQLEEVGLDTAAVPPALDIAALDIVEPDIADWAVDSDRSRPDLQAVPFPPQCDRWAGGSPC